MTGGRPWIVRTLDELRAEATSTWDMATSVGNTTEHQNGDLIAVALPPDQEERLGMARAVTADLRARGATEIGWIFPSTIRRCFADGTHDRSRCGRARHVLIGFALREGEGTRVRVAYRRARGKRPSYGPWEPLIGVGDHPENNPLLAAVEEGFRCPEMLLCDHDA